MERGCEIHETQPIDNDGTNATNADTNTNNHIQQDANGYLDTNL